MRHVPAKGESSNLTLLSTCLLGIACRYDGRSLPVTSLCDLASPGVLLPICPEVAGDPTIPRPTAEIEGAPAGLDGHAVLDGRSGVTCADGADMTAQFIRGAESAVALVQRLGIQRPVLKANSPSCGEGPVASGSVDGKLVAGEGVAAALLKGTRIRIVTEMDLPGGER